MDRRPIPVVCVPVPFPSQQEEYILRDFSFGPRRAVLGILAVAAALLGVRSRAEAQQATVSGQVTAAESDTPLADVRVIVLGTSTFTVTNAQGRYTLRGVSAGSYVVRTLRVGYVEQKRPITVAAGATATLDFKMERTIIQLQQVLTTATGEQRRVEIGNSVSTIDVAKTIEDSPVKNMGDLLVAKAPGVQVLPGNMTSGGSRVRIRGTSSLSLTNDPIYIIDGIRMTSNSASTGIGVGGTSPSRVNDINPEEIENIEVVKGPSAATLYGTDAANGVILITTRKGRAGAPRWQVYAENGVIQDRSKYPTMYAILGHAPATPSVTRRCFLREIGDGTCIKDSESSVNVYEDKELTPIKDGWRWQGGTQLSGGNDAVRYFVSGEYESETGPLGLPNVDRQRFEANKSPIYSYMDRPNTMIKGSFRANLNAAISPTLDLGVTSNFIKLDQRLPQVDNNVNSFWYNGMTGPGFREAGPGYSGVGSLGQKLHGYNLFTPGDIFQQLTTQGIHRFINSGNANWRPLSWMQNRADFGVDMSDRVDLNLCRFSQCSDFGTNRLGFSGDARADIRNVTASLGSTATYQFKTWLNFKTTAGVQYNNFKQANSIAFGSTLPPGAQTPSQGTIPSIGSGTTLQKTLGVFVEEQAALNDRLFITAAMRTDQNSAFGTNFQRVYYPKGALSWILSDEGFFPKIGWLDQFRFRAAIGSSGVQPGPNDALRIFAVSNTNILGADVGGLRSSALGNSDLKPERSTEIETGIETRMFNERVSFEFTYYNKKSQDALINQIIAPSAGSNQTQILRNLGSVRNWGYESLINAQVLNARAVSWDLTLSGSHNSNELITLGKDAAGKAIPPIIGTTIQQREGYPINGYWQRGYTWSDANKDGFIGTSEVKVADSATFRGYSQPRLELSIINGVDLFNRRVRLTALVDHKSGYRVLNNEQAFLCGQAVSCKGISDPNAELWDQARAVAQRFVAGNRTQDGYIEDPSFWRLREVSASLNFSDNVARTIFRAKGASLSAAIRNLKTWSDWTGVDPEQNYSQGDTQLTLLTAGAPSYFTFRVNLRY